MMREYISWLGLFTTTKDVSIALLEINKLIGYQTAEEVQDI